MPPSSILKDCSEFLSKAGNSPLYKLLPTSGEGFRKIKIRKKNRHEHSFERYFDMAFGHQYKDLRLRSMIAQSKEPDNKNPLLEPFYVFPTNGFKILYNQQIDDYASYIKNLEGILHNTGSMEQLLKSLFEYAYVEGDILEAVKSGSDILVYDIPYYYAVRKSLVQSYDNFISY